MGEGVRGIKILSKDLNYLAQIMNFKKIILENGLRVVLVPQESTQAVTVLVLVGVGSRNETKEQGGISHLLEHMFFKGTEKRPNTLAIAEELDRVGGEYNAFTSKEYTGYYAKVDYKHLDLALDVVSDIFLYSKLEDEEIAKEKNVILEEIKMYQDMPMQLVGLLWEELLYGDQPAGWSIAGTPKTVSAVTRDNLINYLKNHYSAKNTLVCLAGKINGDEILVKVKNYFNGARQGDLKMKSPAREEQHRPALMIKRKKTDQSHFCLGARAYNLFHPDRYALSILSIVLGGFMSSRLWISVREKRGLAYYIRTVSQEYMDIGHLTTQAGVAHHNIEKAVEAILWEYRKIKTEKLDDAELNKAKDNIRGSLILDLESSDEVASWVAGQEILKNEILTPEEVFAKIEKVTVDDIWRVANDIFRPEKLNLAIITPTRTKAKLQKLLNQFK